MTRPSAGANPISNPRTIRRRILFLLVLGVLVTAAPLLLVLLNPVISLQFQQAGVWLACLSLYVISASLSQRLDHGPLGSYVNLSLFFAWLMLGLLPALSVAAVGFGITFLVRRWLVLPPRQPVSLHNILHQAASYLFIPVAAVLVAAVLYHLFGHQTPVSHIESSDLLLPFLAALLGAFAATHGMVWLMGSTVFPKVEHYRLLLTEVSLFPLAVILPLIFFETGLAVFVLSMALIATHAIRYYLVEQQARENAELANHLSLIHESTQQIMVDLNHQDAIRIVCETALTVSQADKAAVLLLDDSSQNLVLAASIGLSAAHRERMQSIPYHADRFNGSTRIVPDTTNPAPEGVFIEPADVQEFRAFAEIPLHKNGTPLGYLKLYHKRPHTYTETELYLLNILVSQASAALNNAQLLHALERHAFETSHLVHLSELLSSSLEPDKLGDSISKMLCQMFGLDYAAVALIDEHSGQLRRLGLGFPDFPLLSGDARKTLECLELPMQIFQEDESPSEFTAFLTQRGMTSLILLPLIHAGHAFGVLVLGAVKPYMLDEHKREVLMAAAGQINIQLYNASVFERTQTALDWRLRQLAQIERIVQQISSSQNFNDIIANVLETAAQTTKADLAALALLTEAGNLWAILHEYDGDKVLKSYLPISKDEGVIGRVIQTGEMVLVADNREISFYLSPPSEAYLSSLAVPLVRETEIIGVLNVESSQTNFFTQEQGAFLKSLAAHATISIQNARLLEELQYQIDILTSLRQLSLQLSSAVASTSVAHTVLETALHILEGQYAVLFHHDESTGKLVPLASHERTAPAETDRVVDALRQRAYQAVQTGEMQILEDVLLENGQHVSLLAMPIKRRSQIREVLCMVFIEPQHFQSRDLNTLSLLAIQAAGHLENASLHEKIREGSERMRAILDSTREGIILLNQQGQLVEVNPSAEHLLGINLSEHLGEKYLEVLLQNADPDAQGYAGYSLAELTRMVHSPWQVSAYITRRQFARRTPQNQIIHIAETSSPVTSTEHTVYGRLLVLRDITEEKQLETYRDEITNMIIHNLRGPLSSIINGIRLAKENIPNIGNYPAAAQTLDLGADSARRLVEMVNSLMDIAKLEAQQLNLNYTNVSLRDIIKNAYQDMLPSIQKANITVDLIIPSDLPPVRIDSEKIHRVLTNLMDNALHFTPATGKIQIAVIPERSRLLVQVADSGPGIPEAERDHIFVKYRQAKTNHPIRGSKGSGLGLTFCKLVIEAHGQSIWVEPNSPLRGACFTFTLPYA